MALPPRGPGLQHSSSVRSLASLDPGDGGGKRGRGRGRNARRQSRLTGRDCTGILDGLGLGDGGEAVAPSWLFDTSAPPKEQQQHRPARADRPHTAFTGQAGAPFDAGRVGSTASLVNHSRLPTHPPPPPPADGEGLSRQQTAPLRVQSMRHGAPTAARDSNAPTPTGEPQPGEAKAAQRTASEEAFNRRESARSARSHGAESVVGGVHAHGVEHRLLHKMAVFQREVMQELRSIRQQLALRDQSPADPGRRFSQAQAFGWAPRVPAATPGRAPGTRVGFCSRGSAPSQSSYGGTDDASLEGLAREAVAPTRRSVPDHKEAKDPPSPAGAGNDHGPRQRSGLSFLNPSQSIPGLSSLSELINTAADVSASGVQQPLPSARSRPNVLMVDCMDSEDNSDNSRSPKPSPRLQHSPRFGGGHGGGFFSRMLLPAGATTAKEDPEVEQAVRRMYGHRSTMPELLPRDPEDDLFTRCSTYHGDAETEDWYEEDQRVVLLPDCPFRAGWDLCYMAVLLWEFCMWMLAVFTIHDGHTVVRAPNMVLASLRCCFWTADLWVQSRTAFLDGWEIDDDPESVIPQYMRGRFPFDLFCTLPWDITAWLIFGDTYFWIGMSPRAMRLWRAPSVLFRQSTPIREMPRWTEGVIFFFWFAVLLQVLTCTWMVTADSEEQSLPPNTTMWEDPYLSYSLGLHFVVTTVTSVGYGDISPTSGWGRVHNMGVQFIGLAILIAISGHTAAYFITTDPFQLMVLERKRRIQSLMQTNQVPWSVQKEALTVYPVLLEASVRDYQAVLHELPDFVQDKIARHIKVRLLAKVPLFSNVSVLVRCHLAEMLSEDYIDARTYVIRAGEQGNEMFFLQYGVVEVLLPTEGGGEIWTANLRSGSWFGEIALLQETTRVASVRALTSCVLYKLDRPDFDDIVASSKELRETIRREVERRLETSCRVRQEAAQCGALPSPHARRKPSTRRSSQPQSPHSVGRPVLMVSDGEEPPCGVGSGQLLPPESAAVFERTPGTESAGESSPPSPA
eukprot:TRINITY_DN18655_c0_g3_i2.p1 TRINITY_DN18655_c0_g3~~TRINITY_DN18655_c0_g3_i2.p1  ORF type:complete len:1052 (+),score=315.03 TRINITY_DN18655_c0_g3_i2:97-3156(+)